MDILAFGKSIINSEIIDLMNLEKMLDEEFVKACEEISKAKGHVVITGVGKSGLVGSKIAATLSSLGIPSFFVNANEASHGDLGMITSDDIIIAISNSGDTPELFDIINFALTHGNIIIGITNKKNSFLAKNSNIVLLLNIEKEACYLNLAPTSSTTLTLVLGDAIAQTVAKYKNFTDLDFKLRHPGGKLGKQLKMVDEVMVKENLPLVAENSSIIETLMIMNKNRLGCAIVVNGHIKGIITDGDIRKNLDKDIMNLTAKDVMTLNPVMIPSGSTITSALDVLHLHRITNAPVVKNNELIGVFHIHNAG